MLYVIGNRRLSVTVNSLGAELNSVKKDGKEMLWQNYDGSWAGHSPILFPFCGHCEIKIDNVIYPAPAHGFIRDCEFSLSCNTGKKLILTFTSNNATKKIYPYDFSFSVCYYVRKTTLYVNYIIKNTGKVAMFYGCGGHESFNIDGTLEDYCIEFEKEENLLRLYDDEGYLTGKETTYPTSRLLSFEKMPVIDSKTLIFKNIESNWCKLVKNTGEIVAKTHFKGFKNLLFWRPDDSAMICMEPWTNLPDKIGETADFRNKEGIKALPKGEKKVIKRKIVY